MYCPRCSHEQSLQEMRFCSRCGFPLAGVAMLLENPGIITQLANPGNSSSRRRTIVRESVFLTLLCWAVALAATLFWDFGGTFESVAKAGSLIFFILGLVGLLRFLYAFLFVKDTVQSPWQMTDSAGLHSPTIRDDPTRAALPSARSIPVSDYSRINTREIVSQPSVTESTTRLLEDQDN